MDRAAFLDRDGVINRKAPGDGYVTRWEEMDLLPGVAEAVSLLNKAQFKVILVSNQRCVAKGLVTTADVDAIHRRLCRELAAAGAVIDGVYYCPHEEQPPCGCRKPEPGMLLSAARQHQLDLAASWMIGDSEVDVTAGKKAGCKTARLTGIYKRPNGNADVIAPSLIEAVRQILSISRISSITKMTTEVLSRCGVDLQENFHSELGLEEFASKKAAEASDMPSLSVLDHFRCPKDFLDFGLSGELSSDEGFFRFGPHITCYGRSVRGGGERQVESSLHDTFDEFVLEDGKVKLPFDATEVINNLRLERYASWRASGFESLLRKVYYLVRPFTNLSLRKRVQRFNARNWQKQLFPHWPVDTTVENLCETLFLLSLRAKHMDRIPFVWFWPRGARGCVMMTHDVESKAGRNSCADLMDLDDSFGIKASFQIVPERRYRVSAKLLEMIRSRGFEVGIQDLNHDGRLFDDREEFQRRAALINRYAAEYKAKGFRSAVLYRKPLWYDAFDLSFDMSMPNVAHLDPQRGGCCTVMPYFIDKILELPVTTTQDYMLFHILNQRSIDLWKNQVELIMEKNGLASFIVHPDYVREHESKSIYLDLLGYLRDLRSRTNVWAALPHEIDTWWRARSAMTVEPDGSTWRVVGEGSERAVLAYAKNVDGKLVYELAHAGATL